MRRILLALIVICVSFSLTAGAVAHAAEPISCVDETSAQSMGHSPGDGDQVPADSDKNYPHHHGGCHVHQQALDRAVVPQLTIAIDRNPSLPLFLSKYLPTSTVDPALRPPIA
jgi:hypothetical protein